MLAVLRCFQMDSARGFRSRFQTWTSIEASLSISTAGAARHQVRGRAAAECDGQSQQEGIGKGLFQLRDTCEAMLHIVS